MLREQVAHRRKPRGYARLETSGGELLLHRAADRLPCRIAYPGVDAAVGAVPSRKSKSQPSLACFTWREKMAP